MNDELPGAVLRLLEEPPLALPLPAEEPAWEDIGVPEGVKVSRARGTPPAGALILAAGVAAAFWRPSTMFPWLFSYRNWRNLRICEIGEWPRLASSSLLLMGTRFAWHMSSNARRLLSHEESKRVRSR